MQVFQGKSASGGVATGKIFLYQKGEQQVKRLHVEDTEAELARLREAAKEAAEQLQKLYEASVKSIGESGAAIFEVHRMMLEDEGFFGAMENTITTQSVNAEYAVAAAADNFSKMFSEMDDEYMRTRGADIKDVAERLLSVLSGGNGGMQKLTEPSVVLADDLMPSETVQLDPKLVLAFVTVHGSLNSHTAILARTMNIPALVGVSVPLVPEWNGKTAVVDGAEGTFCIDPTEEYLEKMEGRRKQEQEKRELLQTLKGKETVTKDGKKIRLYANIGSNRDLGMVLENDAEGIGLFRSEFLYLEKEDYPTEEEQFSVYKTVAETMAGKKVIIRTLDIGADKQAPYFHLKKEENPAMGLRAIRICLTRPDIFKTQLRAVFRAAAYGDLAIMYPMIISAEEVRKIRSLAEEAKRELEAEKLPYGNVEQGIMIETPAAVMVSDELAKEVDFFSIGTNDLTQYTLAIDRQNTELDGFYDAHHPAVLKMIRMVVENAHKAGIWAGICGELGADTSLTEEFLRMGVDELSVSPGKILPIRRIVRETALN